MSNTDLKLCSNCDAPMNDKYCSVCGQKIKDYQPSFNNFILALWDDFVSVDAKLLNTLKALFKPGRLTLDWINGKQQRYVHPVRLYIVLTILYSTLIFLGFEGGQHEQSFLNGFIKGMNEGNSHGITQEQINQIIKLTTFLTIPLTIILVKIYSLKARLIKNVFFVVNIYSVIVIFAIMLLLLVNFLILFDVEFPSVYFIPPLALLFTIMSAKAVYDKGLTQLTIKTLLVFIINSILIVSISAISVGYFETENGHIKDVPPPEAKQEVDAAKTKS
ncbi:MAG: hypothetical protein ACI9N3_000586 [Colwellia sp.]|jgi:hypothetical protein